MFLFQAQGGSPSSSNSAHWKNAHLKVEVSRACQLRSIGAQCWISPFLTRRSLRLTHPHVSSTVLLLLLDATQTGGNVTSTSGCETWVEALPVAAISDVEPLIPSNWMWVDYLCRRDSVLPLFLDFSVLHQNDSRLSPCLHHSS